MSLLVLGGFHVEVNSFNMKLDQTSDPVGLPTQLELVSLS